METTASFGYWVRRQRKALDLTQWALAQSTGCSLETIKKIERDERRPSRQLADLLAKALMIPPPEQSMFVQCATGQRSPIHLPMPQPQAIDVVSASKFVAKIPAPSTPLIGRADELAQIAQRLTDPDCRLVTLVGAGGIGKTRVAIAAAQQHVGHFADGVYFVSLVEVNSPAALVTTLLDAFHISQQIQDQQDEQLMAYLHKKRLLLVLDTFEHLRTASGVLNQILSHTSEVKLLITSRERLGVHGEWLIPLTGLDVVHDPLASHETIAACSSVQLFLRCAQRLSPTFAVTMQNAPAIVRICQFVVGMPLAIELAASWVRVMPCSEIERRIAEDIDFLRTTWVDTDQRHRNIRTVLDHSWRLLSIHEQNALCQLSVFHNGFRYEAALHVAGATLSILANLADKSWLRVDEGRFTLHDLVRQFANDHLHRQTMLDPHEVEARHSNYFGDFLHKREAELHGHQQLVILSEIWAEIDNIRAGWRWAVAQCQVDLIGCYLKCLQWATEVRGWNQSMAEEFAYVANHLRKYLNSLTSTSLASSWQMILARVLHCQAQHAIFLGRLAEAEQMCEESLTYLSTTLRDEPYLHAAAYIRLTAGLAFFDQGKYVDCEHSCREAQKYFLESGDLLGNSRSRYLLGLNHFTVGQSTEAEREFAQSLAISTHIGDLWGQAWIQGMLCSLFIAKGDYKQAEHYGVESYRIRKLFEHRLGVAYSLLNLGEIASAQQQYTMASQYYKDALTIGEEINDPHVKGVCLRKLGRLAHLTHDLYRSRHLYLESILIFQTAGRQSDAAITQQEMESLNQH